MMMISCAEAPQNCNSAVQCTVQHNSAATTSNVLLGGLAGSLSGTASGKGPFNGLSKLLNKTALAQSHTRTHPAHATVVLFGCRMPHMLLYDHQA